jgi:hypothetical protein
MDRFWSFILLFQQRLRKECSISRNGNSKEASSVDGRCFCSRNSLSESIKLVQRYFTPLPPIKTELLIRGDLSIVRYLYFKYKLAKLGNNLIQDVYSIGPAMFVLQRKFSTVVFLIPLSYKHRRFGATHFCRPGCAILLGG